MNYFRHYKKLIIILAAAGLFLSGRQLDFSREWLFLLIPAVLILLLLLYEIPLSRENKAILTFWDLREFSEHQKMAGDSLEAIFQEENSLTDLSLKVCLRGIISSSNSPLQAPYSGKPCYGYKLTVGLLKAKDHLRQQNSYSRLLITETRTPALQLRDNSTTLVINDEPLLNLKHNFSKEVSWKGLEKLNEKLKNKINEALAIGNIARDHYTGLIILEEIMPPEEEYTVYGLCSKKAGRLVIEGNTIIDHPESLYITSYTPAERELKLSQLKKKLRLRRLLVYPAILCLAAGPAYYCADFLLSTKGQVYYRNNPLPYKIELSHSEDENYLYWEFEGTEDSGSTRLIDTDDRKVHAEARSQLKISRQLKETQTYTIGRDSLLQWQGVFWFINFPDLLPLPEPVPFPEAGQRIYMKNVSGRDLTISFIQQAGQVTAEQNWTWEAGHGTKWKYGSYAIYYEDEEKQQEKDVLLAAGDLIILTEDKQPLCSYLVGDSPELKAIPDKGWYLLLDEKTVTGRNGKLYIKNPHKAIYTIRIMDYTGNHLYDDSWEFTPGEGTDLDNGKYLSYEHDGGDSEIIRFSEGMQLMITRLEYKPVWDGPLADCPYAEYQHTGRRWEILIK